MRLPSTLDAAHKEAAPHLGQIAIMLSTRKMSKRRIIDAVAGLRRAADMIEDAAAEDWADPDATPTLGADT